MSSVEVSGAGLVDWALWYAGRGWRVLPVYGVRADGSCQCGRGAECGAAGKHPAISGWTSEASSDPDVVRAWWGGGAGWNIGVLAGAESGIWVLDVDRHGGEGGVDGLESLRSAGVHLPETLTASTPSGGLHLVWRWPEGMNGSLRSRAGVLAGVDVRARGGQFVVAPSVGVRGAYEWADAGAEVAEAPADLVALVSGGGAGGLSVGAGGELEPLPEGVRDDALLSLVGRLRADGLSVEAIEAALRVVNQQVCRPPLPDAQVRKLAGRASDWAAGSALDSVLAQALGVAGARELRVQERYESLLVDSDAREMLRSAEARRWARPVDDRGVLADIDVAGLGEVEWLIDGLAPLEANVTVTGGFKIGKTTLLANLVRSLVDGVPFLASGWPLVGGEGSVGYWNFEVAERQFLSWMRGLGLVRAGRVVPVSLRGLGFSLATSEGMAWAVDWARRYGVRTLIVDPFGRAMRGFGSENSNDDVGGLLDRLDRLKDATGVKGIFMAVHTGRGEDAQERGRGATVLDDWADVRWVLSRGGGVGDAVGYRQRWFSAEGRDVDLEAIRLGYDPESRRVVAADWQEEIVGRRLGELEAAWALGAGTPSFEVAAAGAGGVANAPRRRREAFAFDFAGKHKDRARRGVRAVLEAAVAAGGGLTSTEAVRAAVEVVPMEAEARKLLAVAEEWGLVVRDEVRVGRTRMVRMTTAGVEWLRGGG